MKDITLDVTQTAGQKKPPKNPRPEKEILTPQNKYPRNTSPTLSYKGFLMLMGQESCLSSKEIGLNLPSS